MSDGRVEFEITADGRKAYASIDEITEKLRQSGTKWESDAKTSTDNISSSFGTMVKNIAATISAAKIGQTLLNIGKDALQAASDLQEVQNVVDVTFGQAGASKIEAWAKKAGSQFGLTETQAKKFTSTLGAMMKSAGLTGSEITDMSTDLAGLAADMASFYNLDFDTAFQKIRSGISGETEPLKQLGINMSVANLNAYALQQGLSKTFEEMSQGEQTMLRYQYLMQATSDAQGDFVRTADGYANSLRTLETNIETLKTNLGDYLLPTISDIVSLINSVFSSDNDEWSQRRTVLDDIQDIDANTQAALEKIKATKTQVEELTKTLEEIGGKKETLDSATENITGAVEGVSSLAEQLNGITFEEGAKSAFENTLSILYNNVDSLSKIKGTDAEGVMEWLDGVASKASELTPENAAAWAELLGSVVGDIPGLQDTPEGQELTSNLTTYFLSLGSQSEEAKRGLESLGLQTEEIEEKQAAWLQICKDLVSTMPGLADIIDTQTGEIKGGIPAVKEYADEWARVASYQAEVEGLKQKQQVASGLPTQTEVETDVRSKRATAVAMLKTYEGLTDEEAQKVIAGGQYLANYSYTGQNADSIGRIGYDELADSTWMAYQQFYGGEAFGGGFAIEISQQSLKALQDYVEAEYTHLEFLQTQPALQAAYEAELQRLAEEYGVTTEELEAQIEAERKAAEETQQIKTAVQEAADAFKAVNDYYEQIRNQTASQVNSNISGFTQMTTAAEQYKNAANEAQSLWDELASEDKYTEAEIKVKVDEANAQVTLEKMTQSLKSQLEYINEYQTNLALAQAAGVSDELLASLSDGSNESALYLNAIAEAYKAGDTQSIQDLNNLWSEVSAGKETFTDTLTSQKLAADETYDAMVSKAQEAAKNLDVSTDISLSTQNNIQAMADALKLKIPDVAAQVDALLTELNRLNQWGVTIDYGFGASTVINAQATKGGNGSQSIASLAVGMDWIPFDGFLAQLHEGEAVLTAEENRIWQQFKNGGSNVDYDALGGVMRDNIKAGGNVYLNGRVVGQVISQEQGSQYRTLQRSGWQA